MINTRNINESYAVLESANSRRIILPKLMETAGVEADENVRVLKFRFPKTVDGADLAQMQVRINYINSRGEKGQYIVTDLKPYTHDETYVTFSWSFSRLVTKYKGITKFVVCAVRTDSDGTVRVKWNTSLSQIRVLEGLEVSEPVIPPEDSDIVAQLIGAAQGYANSAEESAKKAEQAAANGIHGKVSYYNTVEEMKQDEKLKDGVTVLTLGYYSPGDGGGALYAVRSISSEPFYKKVALNNGLTAELQSGAQLNVMQLGCRNDESEDCAAILQPIIDSLEEEEAIILYFPVGKYKFAKTLTVHKTVSMFGQESSIQSYAGAESEFIAAPNNSVLSFQDSEIIDADAIDANSYHHKTFKNLTIISNSYFLKEDRTNTPRGNRPEKPVFEETIRYNGQNGLHVHGYGSIVDSCCVIGFSGVGILSEQYNYLYKNFTSQCRTGVHLKRADNTVAHHRSILAVNAITISSAHNHITDFRCDSIFGDAMVLDSYARSNNITMYTCDYAWNAAIKLVTAGGNTFTNLSLRAGVEYAGWDADSIPREELSKACAVCIDSQSNSNSIIGVPAIQGTAYDDQSIQDAKVPSVQVVFNGYSAGNTIEYYRNGTENASEPFVLSLDNLLKLARTQADSPECTLIHGGNTYRSRVYPAYTPELKDVIRKNMYVNGVRVYATAVSGVIPKQIGAITVGADGNIYMAKGTNAQEDWVKMNV